MKIRSAFRPLGRAVKDQHLCLPRSHIQSRFQTTSTATETGHVVPLLAGNKDEVFKKYGVPGFMSADTYQATWVNYQKHLCDYINSQVIGTTYERLSVRQLHEHLSRRPADAHLYNYAAQAHHNHFFFNTLSSNPDPIYPPSGLLKDITEYFESLDHLRDEITEAALSIFGQGYVWLMKEMSPTGAFYILATYNSGSPFPAAHTRRQTHDHANGPPPSGNTLGARLSQPSMSPSESTSYAGSFGESSINKATYHENALKALPILCVKVWEHQWLPDYGILGKEAYINNWWKRIDWDQVQNNHNLVPSDAHAFDRAPLTPRDLNRMSEGNQSYLKMINQGTSS